MCAPSNVAVDQLAEKISATGLKVRKQNPAYCFTNFISFFPWQFVVLLCGLSKNQSMSFKLTLVEPKFENLELCFNKKKLC